MCVLSLFGILCEMLYFLFISQRSFFIEYFLTVFVAEGGVDCIQSQKEALQQCLNSTLASRIPTDVTPSVFPVLLFDSQDCR